MKFLEVYGPEATLTAIMVVLCAAMLLGAL